MKIGIDLGGTKTEGILIDDTGKELVRNRIKTEKNYGSVLCCTSCGLENINLNELSEVHNSNLWSDIIDVKIGATVKIEGDKPEQLIERILGASSFKLNWILDPFTRSGGVGVIAKKMGRRFIGFESNKDQLLMALKRIDREK